MGWIGEGATAGDPLEDNSALRPVHSRALRTIIPHTISNPSPFIYSGGLRDRPPDTAVHDPIQRLGAPRRHLHRRGGFPNSGPPQERPPNAGRLGEPEALLPNSFVRTIRPLCGPKDPQELSGWIRYEIHGCAREILLHIQRDALLRALLLFAPNLVLGGIGHLGIHPKPSEVGIHHHDGHAPLSSPADPWIL